MMASFVFYVVEYLPSLEHIHLFIFYMLNTVAVTCILDKIYGMRIVNAAATA